MELAAGQLFLSTTYNYWNAYTSQITIFCMYFRGS